MRLAFVQKVKTLRFDQVIYPALSLTVTMIVIVLTVLAVRFLSHNLNQPFNQNTQAIESELIKIDLDTYNRVAKKLGIAVEPADKPKEQPIDTTTPTPPVKENIDQTQLKIEILNGTTTVGVASQLQKSLESDGFVVAKIADSPAAISGTVMAIKLSKKDYSTTLKQSIARTYAKVATEDLAEADPYDAIITIGTSP